MTEEEWLTRRNVPALFDFVGEQANERQYRLFVCGLARQRSKHLVELRSWQALELAERFSDKGMPTEEREYARRIARQALQSVRRGLHPGSEPPIPGHPRILAAELAILAVEDVWGASEPDFNADFIRLPAEMLFGTAHDIFGNPFRPVAFAPAWLTSTAVALAGGIYADRAFDRLPILADALQDAGCEDADILGHCRGDGPHARGCWVVDLVLGK